MNDLINSIKFVDPKFSSRIVAIDGLGASGKSTLSAKLSEDFPATVIKIDDFYGQLYGRVNLR